MNCLFKAVDPLLWRLKLNAVGLVFVDLPAGAEPQHHPPVRDVIERCRPVGQDRWMVDRRWRHQRADPDGLGDGGDGRKQRPDLMNVAGLDVFTSGIGHVVVCEPVTEVAERVGGAGKVKDLVGGTTGCWPNGEFHAGTLPDLPDRQPECTARNRQNEVPVHPGTLVGNAVHVDPFDAVDFGDQAEAAENVPVGGQLCDSANVNRGGALFGRFESHYWDAIRVQPIITTRRAPRVLIRADDPELRSDIHAGKALITRLEGEAWNGLHHQPMP